MSVSEWMWSSQNNVVQATAAKQSVLFVGRGASKEGVKMSTAIKMKSRTSNASSQVKILSQLS